MLPDSYRRWLLSVPATGSGLGTVAEETEAGRDLRELVPCGMASSPFAFLLGSALMLAGDLASAPRSGLDVQACGDAHLAKFGAHRPARARSRSSR